MKKFLKKFEKKGFFGKFIVLLTFIHIDLYVLLNAYLLYSTSNSMPDQVSIGYFGFWGVEVLSLAGVKLSKTKAFSSMLGTDSEVLKEKEERNDD